MSDHELTEVLVAINNVQKDIVEAGGIAKGQKNTQQHYSYRGIDDIYNSLSPIMAEHGLTCVPRIATHEKTEYTSGRGTKLFNVCVTVEYVFASAIDGSTWSTIVAGEGMDSGDKATSKAMSAAHKYCMIQVFHIPVADNDTEKDSHEVAAEPQRKGNLNVRNVSKEFREERGEYQAQAEQLQPPQQGMTLDDASRLLNGDNRVLVNILGVYNQNREGKPYIDRNGDPYTNVKVSIPDKGEQYANVWKASLDWQNDKGEWLAEVQEDERNGKVWYSLHKLERPSQQPPIVDGSEIGPPLEMGNDGLSPGD